MADPTYEEHEEEDDAYKLMRRMRRRKNKQMKQIELFVDQSDEEEERELVTQMSVDNTYAVLNGAENNRAGPRRLLRDLSTPLTPLAILTVPLNAPTVSEEARMPSRPLSAADREVAMQQLKHEIEHSRSRGPGAASPTGLRSPMRQRSSPMLSPTPPQHASRETLSAVVPALAGCVPARAHPRCSVVPFTAVGGPATDAIARSASTAQLPAVYARGLVARPGSPGLALGLRMELSRGRPAASVSAEAVRAVKCARRPQSAAPAVIQPNRPLAPHESLRERLVVTRRSSLQSTSSLLLF